MSEVNRCCSSLCILVIRLAAHEEGATVSGRHLGAVGQHNRGEVMLTNHFLLFLPANDEFSSEEEEDEEEAGEALVEHYEDEQTKVFVQGASESACSSSSSFSSGRMRALTGSGRKRAPSAMQSKAARLPLLPIVVPLKVRSSQLLVLFQRLRVLSQR